MIVEGMYRQIEIFKLKNNMTENNFKILMYRYIEILKNLENLKFYKFSFNLKHSPFGDPSFDAYLELWFEKLLDMEKMQKSLLISSIDKLRNNELSKALEDHQIVWAKEHIVEIPDGYHSLPLKAGLYKQMGTLKTPPHMSKTELKEWWFEHARRFGGLKYLKWYTILFTLDSSPTTPLPFDGYAQIWFDSLEKLRKAFKTSTEKEALDHVREYGLFDTAYCQEVWSKELSV